MPAFTRGKHQLYYRQSHADNPNKLVLIHGATGNMYHWPAELRQNRGIDVVSVDLPGHGRAKGSAFRSISGYAGVVTEFLKQLQPSGVFLLGHSMGGAISQYIAVNQKRLVKGLALASTGAYLPVNSIILEKSKSEKTKTEVAGLISDVAYGKNVDNAIKEGGLKGMMMVPAKVFRADFGACSRFDIRKRLQEIKQPTLILCGTEDKMTPAEYSRDLHRQIAHSELKLFKDAGHMVMLEEPGAFIKSLMHWLLPLVN